MTDLPPIVAPSEHTEEEEDCYGLRRLAGRIGAVRRFNSGVAASSTPQKAGTTDGVLRYIDASGRQNSTVEQTLPSNLEDPQGWIDLPDWSLKYVDDVNIGECLFLCNAVSTFSQSKEKKSLWSRRCQDRFEIITANAGSRGMEVNGDKTQLLCVTASIHSEVSSYINLQVGQVIESQDNLTILGFRFGRRSNVNAHLQLIQKKFNSQSWVVRHLIQSGVPTVDIVAVFLQRFGQSSNMLGQCTTHYCQPINRRKLRKCSGDA